MAKIFYALLLFPLLGFAAEPKPKVAPKPINVTKETSTPKIQEQQQRPVVDPDAIETGPYDKDGNYIYVHKKP